MGAGRQKQGCGGIARPTTGGRLGEELRCPRLGVGGSGPRLDWL